jgi:hypothetical protein
MRVKRSNRTLSQEERSRDCLETNYGEITVVGHTMQSKRHFNFDFSLTMA